MEPKYYLSSRPNKDKTYLIRLQAKWQGQRVVFTFGESVLKSDWNKKTGAVIIPGMKKTKEDVNDFNKRVEKLLALQDKLSALGDEAVKQYLNISSTGATPSAALLKTSLMLFMERYNVQGTGESDFYEMLNRFINGEIRREGKRLKHNTTKGYGTLKHHLSKFSDKRKYDITFQSINNLFYGKYLAFLEDEFNLGPNSIGKDIKNIKSVMNHGLDEGLHHNRAFQNKSFTKPKEKTSAVYLTMEELDQFYHFDLSGNKALERVRDVFIFMAHTGIRYSDRKRITKENIVNVDGEIMLVIKTQKVDSVVTVPLVQYCLSILEKYDGTLPLPISDQRFRIHLKEAGRLAGLTQTGRDPLQMDVPLYKLLGTHTGKRSFVTAYHESGVPLENLARMIGTTMKTLEGTYRKTSALDVARRSGSAMRAIHGRKAS